MQVALNKGEAVPPLLAVIDTEKAALMKTADVLPSRVFELGFLR